MATIKGTARNDVLRGTGAPDTITGGAGDDIIFGAPGDIKLDGGAGYDTLDLSSAAAPLRYAEFGGQLSYWPSDTSKTYVTNFERVIGSGHKDALLGASGADTLVGNGGNDTFEGGSGDDVFVGDFLAGYAATGAAGTDVFQFSRNDSGNDRILDFQYGVDHLLFYGWPQPTQIAPSGSDLVVNYGAGSSVTLVGLAYLSADAYAGLFTYENDGLIVPH